MARHTQTIDESGIQLCLYVTCSYNHHPVECRLTWRGELQVIDNPCWDLGIFRRMGCRCEEQIQWLQAHLPAILGFAVMYRDRDIATWLRPLVKAIQSVPLQHLSGYASAAARQLATAAEGSLEQLLEQRQQVPIAEWGRWAHLLLILRVAAGEAALMPLVPIEAVHDFWKIIPPSVRDKLLEALSRFAKLRADWRKQIAYHPVEEVRTWGCGLMELWRDAVEELLPSLQDESASVRQAICTTLGEIGDRVALPHLIEATRDRDPRVREAAYLALSNIPDPHSFHVLLEAVQTDHHPCRYVAWVALGKLRDPSAVPALLEAAANADYRLGLLIEWALRELCRRVDDNHLSELTPGCNCSAHKQGKDLSSAGERIAAALVPALRSDNKHLRGIARRLLVTVGVPAVPTVRALMQDSDWRLRWVACQILGEIGSPLAISDLQDAMRDEHERVRRAAGEAVRRIRKRSAVSALQPA